MHRRMHRRAEADTELPLQTRTRSKRARTCVGLDEAHVCLHRLQAVLSNQLLHQLDALGVGRHLCEAARQAGSAGEQSCMVIARQRGGLGA